MNVGTVGCAKLNFGPIWYTDGMDGWKLKLKLGIGMANEWFGLVLIFVTSLQALSITQ